MDSCEHTTWDGKTLFCQECGHAPDPASLRSVRIVGFYGRASLRPRMEAFWASGDAEVFDSRKHPAV